MKNIAGLLYVIGWCLFALVVVGICITIVIGFYLCLGLLVFTIMSTSYVWFGNTLFFIFWGTLLLFIMAYKTYQYLQGQ